MDRALGQLFMMVRLIDDVSSSQYNLKCKYAISFESGLRSTRHEEVAASFTAEDTSALVYELQKCAFDAGHPVPLLIGIDQENGGVNSLFDDIFIRQYPSAMGIAASGDPELAYKVAKASAEEISACGVNWIMGPCLDVLTNTRNQPLGVRTTGDDPVQCSEYGVAFMKGYQEAGICTMGKHFPSYGNLEFLGSSLDVPTITESLEQLSLSALIPFRDAIKQGLDSIMVGGCAMSSAGLNVMHACLSDRVVDGLLRKELGFDGVVVSECLEMDSLCQNIGVNGGTVMAANAGCDILLLCRSFQHQLEAINGFKLGLENSMITTDRVRRSLNRVLAMKSRCTSWEKALNPPGISLLSRLQPSHTSLSTKAYNSSITVVRDQNGFLPLTNIIEPEEELLLLTPLVKPLAASAAAREISSHTSVGSPEPQWERGNPGLSGERVFRELGRSLARQRTGRVLHTSYTANGVRPQHESLINRASAVIVVTADANRNMYQNGFTKHVSMICNMQYTAGGEKKTKPLIVVAVSSPYDFSTDTSIGTYVCTYDFTETALVSLVKVLHGDITPTGSLPGTISRSEKLTQSKTHWLVEIFNEERDALALDTLIKEIIEWSSPNQRSELRGATSNSFLLRQQNVLETHFVVRNSSTSALYGFCSTKTEGIKRFQLGSRLPSIYLGIPSDHGSERKRLRSWFANVGWNTALSRPVCSMVMRNLQSWSPPEGMAQSLQGAGAEFDLVRGWEHSRTIFDHIKTNNRQGLAEVYKLALSDPNSCGIVRAIRPEDGSIVGTTKAQSTKCPQVEALIPQSYLLPQAILQFQFDEAEHDILSDVHYTDPAFLKSKVETRNIDSLENSQWKSMRAEIETRQGGSMTSPFCLLYDLATFQAYLHDLVAVVCDLEVKTPRCNGATTHCTCLDSEHASLCVPQRIFACVSDVEAGRLWKLLYKSLVMIVCFFFVNTKRGIAFSSHIFTEISLVFETAQPITSLILGQRIDVVDDVRSSQGRWSTCSTTCGYALARIAIFRRGHRRLLGLFLVGQGQLQQRNPWVRKLVRSVVSQSLRLVGTYCCKAREPRHCEKVSEHDHDLLAKGREVLELTYSFLLPLLAVALRNCKRFQWNGNVANPESPSEAIDRRRLPRNTDDLRRTSFSRFVTILRRARGTTTLPETWKMLRRLISR
ncbi:glycoside hydrolase, partial [Aureobasidium melanogenum]